MNANPTDTKIFPATEADIASFRECLDGVARERKYIGFIEAPPLAVVREFVISNFIHGNSVQFVAIADDEVVGWCDITIGDLPGSQHTGRLGMGVKQNFRSAGLGKRLLAAALHRAREKGLERVELDVHASNKIAVKLYEKAGFMIEGVKEKARKLDGAYEDIICMALLF